MATESAMTSEAELLWGLAGGVRPPIKLLLLPLARSSSEEENPLQFALLRPRHA